MRSLLNSAFALVLCLLLAAGGAQVASAAIVGEDLGTAAPPATLGGFTMTPFSDARDGGSVVTSVSSPLGGAVGFSEDMMLLRVGSGWATWSHGYTDEVYWTQGLTSVTLTLPSLTTAFYLYAQPNPFSIFHIIVEALNGPSLARDVNGNSGANGFGFYGTAGTFLSSITITSDADFAVGEFGIARSHVPQVPLPAGGLLLLTVARRRAA